MNPALKHTIINEVVVKGLCETCVDERYCLDPGTTARLVEEDKRETRFFIETFWNTPFDRNLIN